MVTRWWVRERQMPSVERLTTFQIGSIYGVPARSLRFYEEQGLLSPLIMDGVRYFTAKDRIRLELIIKVSDSASASSS